MNDCWVRFVIRQYQLNGRFFRFCGIVNPFGFERIIPITTTQTKPSVELNVVCWGDQRNSHARVFPSPALNSNILRVLNRLMFKVGPPAPPGGDARIPLGGSRPDPPGVLKRSLLLRRLRAILTRFMRHAVCEFARLGGGARFIQII